MGSGEEVQGGGAGDGSDPYANAAANAKALRIAFNGYTLAGFSDAQAIYLTGVLLSSVIRANVGPVGAETVGGGDG